MAIFSSFLPYHFLILFFITTMSFYCYAGVDQRKVYIVYMGSLPKGDYSPAAHHMTLLQEILDTGSVSDALVRSYKRSFNGFAAKLTQVERQSLASREEVVSIFPSRTLKPITSRSWDFMEFFETSKRNHLVESDTIIGVIDSGIWPDSLSFADAGFSPPPKKWKGVCRGGANFTCNNKVIGARVYPKHVNSAIDTDGHGSHTASIAAGNNANDVSFFGLGTGTARGGVPSARIAVYKVCAFGGCGEEDILAGFDDAISDGVDVLTVSLAHFIPTALTNDSVAIGSFHAMMKNIITIQGAGNSGPQAASISSVAPWLLTVAASNTDRRFVSKVLLANGKEFIGSAINSFSLKAKDYPVIFGVDAGKVCNEERTRACTEGCLVPELVKEKIILCTSTSGFKVASAAGAAGAISQYKATDYSTIVPFPASILSTEDFESVAAYYNSTKNARAIILKGECLKVGSPPQVASFSSRGPNAIIPDILKPDISAPGVDILAAYSMIAHISGLYLGDGRHTKYNVLSGTSMACPHVAGTAAYVKTFHPDWSPSAVKSAIMTTSRPMDDNTNASFNGSVHEFAYGSGHVDPVKAVDPGLVYETMKEEYMDMLCNTGLSQDEVRKISGDESTCPKASAKTRSCAKDLNYPSMSTRVNTSDPFSIQFTRRATNIGNPHSTYKSAVISRDNRAFKVVVEPSIMSFKSVGERKTYNVTITSSIGFTGVGMYSASLVWSDGVHTVRSPIVLYKI